MNTTTSFRKVVNQFWFILPLILCLTVACQNRQSSDASNVYWYANQKIEAIYPDTPTSENYRIHVGIMATAFVLEKQSEKWDKNLALLQESLSNGSIVDVGVEEGSNKIIQVKKAKP